MKRAAVFLAVAFFLLPSQLKAQAEPGDRGNGPLFTPHHVARLRMVVSAVVSPDGSQVAYVLSVPRELPREKDGPAWAELHVVSARGDSVPYITGPVNVDALAWRPDGKALSFLAKRDKDEFRSLHVIPVRGGEARRVLTHGADIQSYSWAPDGKRVAFLATESAAKTTKTQQDQGFNQEVYEEDARPVRLWVASIEDGKPARMIKLEGSASEVHWNPKEEVVALALAPTPAVDDHLMFRKVHIVDLKSGEVRKLKNPGKLGQLAWSPDGKWLAFITGADKHDPREGRLWVHHRNFFFRDWVDLLPDFEGHVESIAWHDGNWLHYTVSQQVWTVVRKGRVGADTTGGAWFDGSAIVAPIGGPILQNLSASNDGKALAFVGHTPTHPPEVYYLGPGDKSPRRLTDSNPWLRTMTFAPQEVAKYKARDGLEIEGILIRPLDEKKGQRYPLILMVHGGPEAHYSNGWSTLYHTPGQVAAARGMAVFYPNYRGSTGRGVKFSMLGQRQAAGKEFDDLIDGVDHLIASGLVDAKKVGITGGSYGGYATAWGATYYSDRFAAGVMFVGLSNNVSCAGTTDIPHEMHLVHHRKWLWEDWDYFLKSSPVYHVEKSKTPLLILHGKADPRVHPSQSLELYRHLKVRGKAPVRLVLYPGEGHGNRRAASRLDYNLRLMQWMEHYLKGPGGAAPPYEIDYGLPAASKSAAAAGAGWRTARREEVAAGEECWLASVGVRCPCCIGW